MADYFKELDFHVIVADEEGTTHIATQRFADYERLLRTEHFSDVDYVMHTDIRDVIFQRNPLDWFAEAAKENEGHLIYASTEGITFRHEDWNGEGLQHHFGEKLYQELQDVETLCSGVFAAQKGAFADLCKAMYQTAFWSQDPGGFIDQHFYNMLLRKSFDSITRFVPADSPYVANLGTLAAIPFNDPKWSTGLRTAGHSYERFRKGTYVENMLVGVPQMIDGKVCTPSGEPYAIVHQYDRYAPWKEALIGKGSDVTVVTALYDLGRQGWKGFERPFDNYKEWMRSMLSFDTPMVVFVDPADVKFVEDARLNKESKTSIIPIKFSEFVTEVNHGEKIRQVMQTKEFLAGQAAPNHPQVSFPDYNILMHEKIQFVKRAIEDNPFNTSHYMWLDAGVYHMNNRHDLIGEKFPTKKGNFLDSKMHFICIEEPTESDLQLESFYKGHNVKIIGTSWMGHKAAILDFEKSYTALIAESLDRNLMDQDQSFLTVTALRNPDICTVHAGSWKDALNLWS